MNKMVNSTPSFSLSNLISLDNKYLSHLIRNQKWYLMGLMIFLLGLPLFSNYLADKPLLIGMESYYHLSNAKTITGNNFYYYPLHLVSTYLPEWLFSLFPMVLGVLSLYLLWSLTRKIGWSEKNTFVFMFLLIIMPAFMFTFITLSNMSLFLVLVLLGLNLSFSENKWVRQWSFFPFILATFFDLTLSLFLLLIESLWIFHFCKKEERSWFYIIGGATALMALSNFFFLNIPLFSGPFNEYGFLVNLISDLGGISGISLFLLILAVLGLSATWKIREYRFLGILFLCAIFTYLLSSQYVFLVGIFVCIFGTRGFVLMIEQEWKLPILKNFTLLIILLGLIFSVMAYSIRVTEIGPSADEVKALGWINDNLPSNMRLFSDPESSYYLSYFGNQQPLVYYHDLKNNPFEANLTEKIFASVYTTITFPLLLENNLSIIYISPLTKQKYSSEGSLISVLKNERFKMVHSSGEVEVWAFS